MVVDTPQADEAGTASYRVPWWPGEKYVTWVGIDGYYYRPSETFFSIFGKTIAEVRALTGLPILLSEVAVGPQAGQAQKIPDLFAGMRHYGTLGLVWFDIAQNNGVYHQDWHIEDNPSAKPRSGEALPRSSWHIHDRHRWMHALGWRRLSQVVTHDASCGLFIT